MGIGVNLVPNLLNVASSLFGGQSQQTNSGWNITGTPNTDPQEFNNEYLQKWLTTPTKRYDDSPEAEKSAAMIDQMKGFYPIMKLMGDENEQRANKILDKQFGMQTLATERLLPWKMALADKQIMGELGVAALQRPPAFTVEMPRIGVAAGPPSMHYG